MSTYTIYTALRGYGPSDPDNNYSTLDKRMAADYVADELKQAASRVWEDFRLGLDQSSTALERLPHRPWGKSTRDYGTLEVAAVTADNLAWHLQTIIDAYRLWTELDNTADNLDNALRQNHRYRLAKEAGEEPQGPTAYWDDARLEGYIEQHVIDCSWQIAAGSPVYLWCITDESTYCERCDREIVLDSDGEWADEHDGYDCPFTPHSDTGHKPRR